MSETFWSRDEGKVIKVGMTHATLVSLGQIWQFISRIQVGQEVIAGMAVATVETSNQLRSLVININGKLVSINPEILENPEKISENTEIFSFSKVGHALLGL